MGTAKLWDIFCRVVDNYGDIGVCWRLAKGLAAHGQQVRLWTDDTRALPWMAPGALEGRWPGVRLLDWDCASAPQCLHDLEPAEVWVEGFGCTLPEAFVRHRFGGPPGPAGLPVWIDLEYLSAESFVDRSHGLPSPILQGPAAGHTRHCFFPGFTPDSGGLLREPALAQLQRGFDAAAFLRTLGIDTQGAAAWSLFCYEPPALDALLRRVMVPGHDTHLLVTQGRATAAVRALLGTAAPPQSLARLHFLPALSQEDYDRLLWACALNFVRGEDSLVRALWAGVPWVWHIYPQEDGAHRAKLQALFDRLSLQEDWRRFQWAWNGLATGPLPPATPERWAPEARRIAAALGSAPDLVNRLLHFVALRSAGPARAKDAKI